MEQYHIYEKNQVSVFKIILLFYATIQAMKRFSFIILFISFFLVSLNASAQVNPSLCTPEGVFKTPNTGSFALDNDEISRAGKALSWMYSMMEPLGNQATGGTIRLSQNYDFSHTGVVQGSYTLDNPQSHPLHTLTPLTLTSHNVLSDTYRGTVSGLARGISSSGTHEVRAYLFTDSEYLQENVVPASVGADGSWNIDLSPVDSSFAGAWHFRLYEKASQNQIGESWPQPVIRENLDVALYAVTDKEYFTDRIRASSDGTFRFNQAAPGTKRVKLIDTRGTLVESDDKILAVYNGRTGIVRSYELSPDDVGYGTAFQERGYVYDQALVLSSSLLTNNQSRSAELAKGLLMFQNKDGAFHFSAPQLAPTETDAILRTGAHSIALYSLLQFIEKYPNDPNITSYKTGAQKALGYLETLRSKSGPQQGLYLGGSGRYVNDIFQNYTIPWASTEHNLDTLHALRKAGLVLKNTQYTAKADALEKVILTKLWNPETKRFYQGYSAEAPDVADALDTASWGSIALASVPDSEKSLLSLERLDIYEHTDPATNISGWGPYSSLGGYPGAVPTVWFEGSFGVLMAYARNNFPESYAKILDVLKKGQLSSGAFPYASSFDQKYEIITSPAIASTAWYVLATVGRDSFWSECRYQKPVKETPPPPPKPIEAQTTFDTGSRKRCDDPKANNYSQSLFAIPDNTLCMYSSVEKTQDQTILPQETKSSENQEPTEIGVEVPVSQNETPFITQEYIGDNNLMVEYMGNNDFESLQKENVWKTLKTKIQNGTLTFKDFFLLLWTAFLNFLNFIWNLLKSLFYFIINLFS